MLRAATWFFGLAFCLVFWAMVISFIVEIVEKVF